ncbi:MAG: glycosyltransferase family 39 protein [Anaerolineaceae bacterium]|nr:glycosyltransferase family 39 protein [Anaerolineaceae bacterium]
MKQKKAAIKLSSIGWIILIAAVFKFAIHLIYGEGYEYFMDELYTLAMSRHLALGYIDLPPLVPFLMAVSRAMLGNSFFAYHVFPALAGCFTMLILCLITRELGGKEIAVALTAVGFIIVPLWLALDSFFCYDAFDQLALSAFLFAVVKLYSTANRRYWLLIGLLAGLACLCKITILFYGPGFLLALLISNRRKDLLSPWPYLGAAVFLVVVSPYLYWQVANGFPSLEYWTNYGSSRLYDTSLKQYLINILILTSQLLLPLWLAGLYRIFRSFNKVNYSVLGFLFLFTFGFMFYLSASVRQLIALFMPLLAAGSVFTEEMINKIRWRKPVLAVLFSYLAVVGALNITMSLPILPASTFPSLVDQFGGFSRQLREFNGDLTYYPITYSGRLGWTHVVEEIADVYYSLPEEEQAIAGIYAGHYIYAGAVDQIGPQYGLPHAVSGHLTYYLWGPGYSWDVMIILSGRSNSMSMFFDQCEQNAQITDTMGGAGYPVYIYTCKGNRVDAETIWGSVKSYR